MPDEIASLPFLTRKMLAFEGAVTFNLRLQAIASTAGTLIVRGATKEGPFSFRQPLVGNLASEAFTFSLPDVPIWVTINALVSGYTTNQCWARLTLQVNGDNLYELCAGYITSYLGVSWPQTNIVSPVSPIGRLTINRPANPAAGSDLSLTVPTNTIWRIRSISFQLVTAAAVATRTAQIVLTISGNEVVHIISATTQLASLTRNYSAYPNLVGNSVANGSDIIMAIPGDLLLGANGSITTLISNMQGADQISNVTVYVEEYLEPVFSA